MANPVYDDQKDKTGGNVSDDDLRRITGIGVGEEDQMDAAARDKSRSGTTDDEDARARRGRNIHRGLDLGLEAAEHGAFGNKIKPLAQLAREELRDAEARGFDFNNLQDKGWYKDQAKGLGKKAAGSFFRRNRNILMTTFGINVFLAALVLFLFWLAPFKHIHFETISRTANFAHFQYIVRKQFTRVIFEASVLTQDSVGSFRNSPLVRQIRLAIPDAQLAQLGQEGKVRWEFHPNASFGQEILPLRETLKGVVIDGERYFIDDFAQESFGKNYNELTQRERWTVENKFTEAVNVKMGDLLALMPRHVRWNPSIRFQQKAGIRLVRWLNAAREYLGKTSKEAISLNATEVQQRVMEPGAPGTKSGIPQINEDAAEVQKDNLEAAKEGRAPPGTIRSKMASRAKIAKGTSDVVFATSAYCIGRELARLFTPEHQAEREAQAARMGALESSTTDQIKERQTTEPALLAADSQWDGAGEVPDAVSSVLYSRVTGQRIPENPVYQQQIPWLNPMMALGDWYPVFQQYNNIAGPMMLAGGPLPGLLSLLGIDFGAKEINDGVCTAIMNEYVQNGIAAAEILVAAVTLGTTKGVTAAVKATLHLVFHLAVGIGLDQLLSLLIDWVVKEYARLYFTGLERGADRFNAAYVAQSSIAQNSTRNINYGRPVDLAEANEVQAIAMNQIREEYRQKPLAERYFAFDNPFSLAGLTVAKLPVSASGIAATTRNSAVVAGSILTSPFRLLGTIGNTIFPTKSAHAEGVAFTDSSFGVSQWSWSAAELERIENDPTFSLEKDASGDPPLLKKVEPRITELNARYGKCYDSNTFRLQIEKPDECTKDFLSAGHPQYGDDALYWRFYNFIYFGATHLSGSV